MRRWFVFFLLLLLLIPTQMVSASESEREIYRGRENISSDHQWSIFYNTPIDKESVHQDSVYVINVKGEKVDLSYQVSEHNVTIIPPEEGYELGEDYTLVLKDTIKSEGGIQAFSEIHMDFSVSEGSQEIHWEEREGTDLYVRGQRIKDHPIFAHEGIVYVPLKPVIQQLGGGYEEEETLASVHLGEKTYHFYPGRNVVYDQAGTMQPLHTQDEKPTHHRIIEYKEEIYVPLAYIQAGFKQKLRYEEKHEREHYIVGEEAPDELFAGESFPNPLNVPLLNQMSAPQLYNGCEITSLAMMFQYHGVDVTKNELANQLPRVPLTYANGLKGNPNEGFVGDMENGPGLSVYHGPIAELAKSHFGDRAVDLTGSSPNELYRYIDQGEPVWVIHTTRLAPVQNFQTWNTPQGKIDVTFSVHSVVITGYTEDSVYVNNPYGKKNQKVNRKQFEAGFKQMGSQALVIKR